MTTFRMATRHDSAGILDIYRPIIESTTISFEFAPPTLVEMGERIQKTLAQFPWLVCETDGRVAGYVYGGAHRGRAAYQWSVDVSVYVHEAHRGRRLATGLYTALFEVLKLQGYYTAFAGVTLPNPPSVALHESLGFTPVGVYHEVGYKFGKWHDTGWWELPLQRKILNPEPPQSIGDVVKAAAFDQAINTGQHLIR